MDIKVLAAVFITLFGIAMGMAQGDIQVDDLSDLTKLADRFKNLGSIGSGLDLPSGDGPAPNTTITAEFSGDTGYKRLTFDSPVSMIRIEGGNVRLRIAGLTTTPSSISMVLHNYTGTLEMDGNVTVAGKVRSIEVANLPFNTSKPQTVKAVVKDPRFVRVDGLHRTDLSFSSVDGSIQAGDITISLSRNDSEQVVFRSFTGTLARNFTDDSYRLSGEVFKAGKKGTQAMVGGE